MKGSISIPKRKINYSDNRIAKPDPEGKLNPKVPSTLGTLAADGIENILDKVYSWNLNGNGLIILYGIAFL